MPTIKPLTSASVDLGKDLGHTVFVSGSLERWKRDDVGKGTGAKGAPAFNVQSLEMVATSCS